MNSQALNRDDILLDQVKHDTIKSFLMDKIKNKKHKLYKHYLIYSIVFSVGFIFTGVTIFTSFISNGEVNGLLLIVMGIVFSFTLLIPLHEMIHATAYKICGAKNIYFGGNYKKFIFYAASDRSILDGKKYLFVALAPFILVNFICIVLFFIYPSIFPFLITVITLHAFFCSGDFAIINYMSSYDLEKFYTYDSKKNKETFFYLKN